MWIRCTTTQVRSRYTIEISIQSYWRLIADKLTADGFVDESDIIVPAGVQVNLDTSIDNEVGATLDDLSVG